MGHKSILVLPGRVDTKRLFAMHLIGSRRLDDVHFEDALYQADQPCVLEWRDQTFVFWSGLYEPLIQEKGDRGLEDRIIQAAGAARAYHFASVSGGVNLYGIVAWEGGRRIRRLVGWCEKVEADEGPPLAEELIERDRYRTLTLDGQTFFQPKEGGERLTHDQVGENFVFAAAVHAFGGRLDCQNEVTSPLWDMMVPRYETWEAHCARLYGD
jgi:hypothetical protein